MTTIVNVHQAKTQFSRLLKRAHEGEEIVLAKAGKPYARLVPLEEARPRVPGIADGRVDDRLDRARLMRISIGCCRVGEATR